MFENIFKEEIQKNPRNPKNYGMTPFHFACENGHIRIAEFIMKSSIENNIDLNAKNSSDEWHPRNRGFTGFHYACQKSQVILKLTDL